MAPHLFIRWFLTDESFSSVALALFSFSGRHTTLHYNSDDYHVCALASTLKVPLTWIYGQLIVYLTRKDQKMKKDAQSLRDEFNQTLHANWIVKKNPKYIAVHARGGQPDGNRRIVPIDQYILTVESHIAAFRKSGIITNVSGDNVHSRIDIKLLNSGNRLHKYVAPTFLDTGEGEQEYHAQRRVEIVTSVTDSEISISSAPHRF